MRGGTEIASKSRELVHFFHHAKLMGKLGPNCLWNNIGVALAYHGLDPLSFAYLNFGCIYTGRSLPPYEESGNDRSIRWIDRYIRCIKTTIDSSELNRYPFDAPVLISVDSYYLGLKFPVFPKSHTYHIIGLLDIQDDQAMVIDNHFGFAGFVKLETISSCVNSEFVTDCGEMFLIQVEEEAAALNRSSLKDQLQVVFQQKVEDYLDGVYWRDLKSPGGLQAIQCLTDEIESILTSFLGVETDRGEGFKDLYRGINVCFTYPREGCLNMLKRYADWFPFTRLSDLVSFYEESLKSFKSVIFRLMIGEQCNQTVSHILKELKIMLEKAERTEISIYELFRTMRSGSFE